jgi:hypothetical protein
VDRGTDPARRHLSLQGYLQICHYNEWRQLEKTVALTHSSLLFEASFTFALFVDVAPGPFCLRGTQFARANMDWNVK